MITFNLQGDTEKVDEAIDSLKQSIIASGDVCGRIVSDSFPTSPNKKDVNLTVQDKFADVLVELCEELDIECEMV